MKHLTWITPLDTGLEDKSNLSLGSDTTVFTRSLLAEIEVYVASAPTGIFYQNINLGILILELVSHSLYSPLKYNIAICGIVLKIELTLWGLI